MRRLWSGKEAGTFRSSTFDALVNRLGARFPFTYHIRVDKQRCTGCNACAHGCMCGAIKMVDRVAVVDQLSCMSCHECVDLCDWNAIEWTPAARNKVPKRIKRGVEIHPEPQWQAIQIRPYPSTAGKRPAINWLRVVNGVIFTSVATVVVVSAWMN